MDYQFYIKSIAIIPEELRLEALSYVQGVELDISRSYFNENRHVGFNSITYRIVTPDFTGQGPAARYIAIERHQAPLVVEKLVEQVSHIYDPSALSSFEINRLEPGGEILEHTDQTTTVTSLPYTVPHYHTVHIPLQAHGVYYSRRGYFEPWQEMAMPPGKAYAYNNYVLHKVENPPDRKVRFNLILHFHDPQWVIKRKLYDYAGLDGGHF